MTATLSTKRGLVWSAINSWVSILLSFGIITTLARLLEPDDFGLVGLAMVVIAFGSIVISNTMSAALIQHRTVEDAHLHTAFWIMFILSVVICSFMIIAAPSIAYLLAEPRLTRILQVISFRLVLDGLSAVPFGLLQKERDFKTLALRSFVANTAGGLVGIVLAFSGSGVWALVAQQLMVGVLNVAICLPRVAWRPRIAFSSIHAGDLIPFSGYAIIVRICGFSNVYIVRIIIANAMGVAAVGYFSFARRIQEMSLEALSGIVTAVAFPVFAAQQENAAELRATLFRAASRTSLIAFPAFLGLAAIAPDVIPLLFGAKWIPAIPIIQVFACVSILSTIGGIHESLMNAMGRISWWSALALGSTILQMGGYLIAVSYGLTALAASVLIVSLLTDPILLWLLKRLIPVRLLDYLRLYAAPLVAATGMGIALLVLRHQAVFDGLALYSKVILEIGCGAVVYVTLVFALARDQMIDLIRYVSPFASAA